ncbi:MAG TPA: PAS domain-containing protein, partial [Chryseosolibacter sp.]
MESGTVFSNEFLLEGFKQAPVAIVIVGIPNYTVKMANPCYLLMVDRSEKDLIGRPLFDVIPEIRGVAEPLLNEVLASHKPYFGNEVETLLNRHGKTQITYFNIVYQPVRGTDGTIDRIMVIANEVTELVQAKQRLQESEQKFRVMVFQSPIAMAILRGSDFVVELANDALLKNLWRRERQEVQGRKLEDLMPEFDVHPFLGLLRKAFESGAYHSEKEKLVHFSDGSSSHFDFEFSPLFNHDRTVSGVLVTAYDVSEKVAARQKREENEDRLKLVLEASGLGTWELNLKSGELIYSDEYLACFGVSEPLSHEQLLEFIHPDDLSIRRFAFQEALSTGWLHYIVRLQWKDKSIHWIEANGKVIYDESGEPCKIIGASRDLTEEKLYQKSIKESEQKF